MSNGYERLRAFLDTDETESPARDMVRDLLTERDAITEQLAAAHALIERVRETALSTDERSSVLLAVIRELVALSPTDALQAHDRQVADVSWKRGYDACREGKQRHSPYRAVSLVPGNPEPTEGQS